MHVQLMFCETGSAAFHRDHVPYFFAKFLIESFLHNELSRHIADGGNESKSGVFLVCFYHRVLFFDHQAKFAANTSPMPFVSNMGIQITQDLRK